MTNARFDLRPVGIVQSALTDLASAPKQAHEGAPEAWLVFDPQALDALDGMRVGDDVIVLTWLDRADRDVLRVHPRGDVSNPIQGAYSPRETRSASRSRASPGSDTRISPVTGAPRC